MSFFDPPPRPPRPEPPEYRQPAWIGPPDNVIGRFAGLEPVVVRADQAAVALDGFVAYPTGVAFALQVRGRVDHEDLDPFDHGYHRRRRASTTLPDHLLRVGVQFGDGRKATSIGDWFVPGGSPPEGPRLSPRGGGGGGRRWHRDMWLWPLPSPGPLTLVVAWPRCGIAETRVERDAGPLLRAAEQALELWPDDRPEPPLHDALR